MKLNKKGSSLIELIVSIALIAVILVFLVKLLVDVNDANTNNVYAKENQINRYEIIRTIENDINNKVITDIKGDSSSRDNLVIDIFFKDGTRSKIDTTDTVFNYTSSEGKNRKWTIEDGTIYVKRAKIDFNPDNNNKVYALQINIEIHTVNDRNKLGNNNTLDDITISFIGNVSDYNKLTTCLGDAC